MAQVIVVGGGLAGLSAAHTVLERGGNVLLLDKNGFFGGNSTKATSGINGALTRSQIALEIKDSQKQFYDDTVKSARDLARPDLIKVLTYKSAAAVEWLQDMFDLDLSLVSRLGGHSQPRTHRGHQNKFPGMAITYALMEKMEELAESQPDRVKIIKKARVTKLVPGAQDGTVGGCEYEFDGKTYTVHGPVVLATGGYAADFDSPDSLLAKYRPDVMGLSTTNGAHCTGDGHKMVISIGGNSIDMEKVQVHPTGLVDPKDPDAKVKFLCAEAVRGVGALLLDASGKRFCDELGHRDYVSNEMFKNGSKIRLVLNSKGAGELEWHCKHYVGRGLMKKIVGIDALAKEFGTSPAALKQTFDDYNDIAAGKKKDPFGKKFFHNLPFTPDDTFHVAVMQPVLHYTMGGVEINEHSQVLDKHEKPIEGLFACGELAGGVHGANRLGGSSLAGCVVYGRVAGESSSNLLMRQLVEQSKSTAGRRLGQVGQHLIDTRVRIDPVRGKVNVEYNFGSSEGAGNGGDVEQAQDSNSASAASADSEEPAPAKKEVKKFEVPDKEFTAAEIAKHNTEGDVWVAINGMVLDVTKFLPDHPGGPKAIMLYAGREASEEYNMLHDPDTVEKYAPDTVIGKYKE